VLELDEELHFNRYRARTLEWSWSRRLPWRDAYLEMCRAHEPECVSAGSWGKRWTNPSCEAMFGPPGTRRRLAEFRRRATLEAARPLDAVKDAHVAAGTGPRLIRLAVHDELGGTPLDAILHGGAQAAPEVVRALVGLRTA
jgi:hypothetical protein